MLKNFEDLNACLEDISNIWQEYIKETVPAKEYQSNTKWMTEEVLNLMRERRGAKESGIQRDIRI